jgi:hypothetical protein
VIQYLHLRPIGTSAQTFLSAHLNLITQTNLPIQKLSTPKGRREELRAGGGILENGTMM